MARKSRLTPFQWFFIALLAVGACGGVYLAGKGFFQRSKSAGAGDVAGMYAADTPLSGTPENLQPGLILLSVQDLLNLPETDGFQWPCGAPDGAMTYDAQPFGSPNPARGGLHTGADLNGIGGENSDKGQPVCAAARGMVVYCGKPSEDWGNVVVLAHRLPGSERVVQTLYAHLEEIHVGRGMSVGRGQQIGTIGTADGRYLAHLHFEVIESRCTEAGMPGYHPARTMNRLDPAAFIHDNPAPAVPDIYATARRTILKPSETHTTR